MTGDERPRPGGVLRVGVTRLSTLDPAQARSIEQLLVADQLFDSLTAPDAETLDPVPSLAARWEASPDQRQWTFFLRPGRTFSNGRPVVATDVKYTLERIVRRGSGSPAADLLQAVSGYVGFRVQGTAPELAGVTAPAPDVVRISLDQPLSTLPAILSSPVFGVVPREAVEAQAPQFAEEPVASGPFRLQGRTESVLSLVPSPGATTFVAGLEVVQFESVDEAYRAFVDGALDWSRVPPEEAAEAGARHGRAGFRPYVAAVFFGFNLRNPKLADVRFREAIVRALDRRAIVTAVYQGTVRPVDGMVLEGVAGHQGAAACEKCRHSLERARALVAEVFATSAVPEVSIDFDEDASQQAMAQAMQASLQEAGIPAILRPKPVRDYDQFVLSGQQEIFRLGWILAFPSAEAVLPPLFTSGSPNNLMGLADPAVDEKLRAARAEGDQGRRLQLYQEAERTIMGQVPVVPVAQFQIHSVAAPRVRGLTLTPMGTFDVAAVWLAAGR